MTSPIYEYTHVIWKIDPKFNAQLGTKTVEGLNVKQNVYLLKQAPAQIGNKIFIYFEKNH